MFVLAAVKIKTVAWPGQFIPLNQLRKMCALLQESPDCWETVAQKAKTIIIFFDKGPFPVLTWTDEINHQVRVSKLRLQVDFWPHISGFLPPSSFPFFFMSIWTLTYCIFYRSLNQEQVLLCKYFLYQRITVVRHDPQSSQSFAHWHRTTLYTVQ